MTEIRTAVYSVPEQMPSPRRSCRPRETAVDQPATLSRTLAFTVSICHQPPCLSQPLYPGSDGVRPPTGAGLCSARRLRPSVLQPSRD